MNWFYFFFFQVLLIKNIEYYEIYTITDKITVIKFTLEYLGKYKAQIIEEILQISKKKLFKCFIMVHFQTPKIMKKKN
jgi:hypothetical protein